MDSKQVPVQVYPMARRRLARPADAFITKSGVGYKVHAPAIVNGGTELFLIANLAPDVAMVTLPEEVVLPGVGPTDVPTQNIAEFALRSGAGGGFSYSVVMKPVRGGLVTAHGNSDPVIIIDPPCP